MPTPAMLQSTESALSHLKLRLPCPSQPGVHPRCQSALQLRAGCQVPLPMSDVRANALRLARQLHERSGGDFQWPLECYEIGREIGLVDKLPKKRTLDSVAAKHLWLAQYHNQVIAELDDRWLQQYRLNRTDLQVVRDEFPALVDP